MSSVFAIGDIHGCADELEELLKKFPLEEDSLVIFLGDYIDRGPDAKRVVDLILHLRKFCSVVALKGNHEMMLEDFLRHPASAGAALFILNGGNATLSSYSTENGEFDIPQEHLEFYASLKMSYETEKFYFVHAGVPNKPLSDVDEINDAMSMLWVRSPFLNSGYDWGKMIVHGHTPKEEIEVKKNRINLDTGCVYGGELSALDLSKEELYCVKKKRMDIGSYFLTDKNPRRRAYRFIGGVSVFMDQSKGIEFITLNYNQFGLLIREVVPVSQPSFKINQKVKGVIGKDRLPGMSFTGDVVRVDSVKDESGENFFMYGVEIVIDQNK